MEKEKSKIVKTELMETFLSTASFAVAVIGFILLIFVLPASFKFFKFVLATLFSFLTIQIFKFVKIWFSLTVENKALGGNRLYTSIAILLKNWPSALYITAMVIVFFACIVYLPNAYGLWVGIGVGILFAIVYAKLFRVPFFSKKKA